jgi:hypothetical protein
LFTGFQVKVIFPGGNVAPLDGLKSWTMPIVVELQLIAVAETMLEAVEPQEFLAIM